MDSRPILSTAAVVVVAVLLCAVVYAQSHAPYYVLDAFGGVHAGGGAPVITPGTPYFGFDVAADIEYIPVGGGRAAGDGVLVLDKYGGVHKGGALAFNPPSGGTPYFGFDAARAIVYRDVPSRIARGGSDVLVSISNASSTYTNLLQITIHAPISGFLHVVGTANLVCPGLPTQDLVAELSTNVDALTSGTPSFLGYATWSDCATASGVFPARGTSVSAVYSVGAGTHTVYLLARKVTGTASLYVFGRTLTAQFVAQDFAGQLSTVETATTPVAGGARGDIGR